MKDLVSFGIVTYNNQDNVISLMETALKFTNEIIVVDCGSTDNTLLRLSPFKRYINLVEGATRYHFGDLNNMVVSRTTLPWIFFPDAKSNIYDFHWETIYNKLLTTKTQYDAFKFIVNNNSISKVKKEFSEILLYKRYCRWVGRTIPRLYGYSSLCEDWEDIIYNKIVLRNFTEEERIKEKSHIEKMKCLLLGNEL